MPDFPNNPATTFPDGGAKPAGPVTSGQVSDETGLAAAVNNAAYLKYLEERMRLIEMPMNDIKKDQLAQQAAQFAAQQEMERQRMKSLELPMLEVHQREQQLAEDKQRFEQDFNNRAQQIDERMKSGGLALSATGQASDESIRRAALAQTGLLNADTMDLNRQAAARAGLGQAESEGLARQTAGANAANEAEQNIIARERLGAADIAGRMNDQALQAARLEADLRGPRNAFAQQAATWGLNASGLNKGIEALQGMPGVTAFQAQASPGRATLGTMAEDMRAQGGQATGPTPWDLMNQTALRNTQSPIGVGTQGLLDVADRNIAEQYSPYALGAGELGFHDAANPNSAAQQGMMGQAQREDATSAHYSSPTMSTALGIAAVNAPEAAPIAPSDLIRGGGQALINTYNNWVKNSSGQKPPPDVLQAMVRDQLGMTDAEAREMIQKNTGWFVNGLGTIPGERMEYEAQAIKQRSQRAEMQDATGVAQRGENAYYDILRQTGLTGLSANDPKLLNMIQQVYGVDAQTARSMAEQNADYARATGSPIPTQQVGQNIAQVGGGAFSPTPAQATPTRTTWGQPYNYTQYDPNQGPVPSRGRNQQYPAMPNEPRRSPMGAQLTRAGMPQMGAQPGFGAQQQAMSTGFDPNARPQAAVDPYAEDDKARYGNQQQYAA